jgi:surface protein
MFTPTNSDELRNKILEIVNGGNIPDSWNISAITNLSSLFSGIKDFSRLGFIENWDVSNVENMSNMFYTSMFNQPLNNWNVSKVKNMSNMFENCLRFNQPLNNWNVSNVENMSNMFNYCIKFNQPLNNWNVSNVKNMSYMFHNCFMFNQPLNNWDVSNVKNMRSMFENCYIFNQPLNWNLSNVEDMSNMFEGCPLQLERIRRQQKRQQKSTQKSTQIAEQMQRAAQIPIDDKKEEPFPKCIICDIYLNNNAGPGPSRKCENNCNDVINVCENNHLFHRGCILNSCNADRVDVASQMGFNQFQSLQTQSIATTCPICRAKLLPDCQGLRYKERVPTENINIDGIINKGGKRKRRCNRKTMKCKKSRKTKKGRKGRKTKRRKL